VTQLRFELLERRIRILAQPWMREPFHRELRDVFAEAGQLKNRCEHEGRNGGCSDGSLHLCYLWHPDDHTTDRADYLELCPKHHKDNDIERIYNAAKIGNLILRKRSGK